jgi:AcrR family transcriptional regulator
LTPARRRPTEPPGTGTLREEGRRRTRRRLADAALELFGEIGYAAATADGIARRAEAGRATFYLHFASKVEVVLELMERVDAEVAATWAALDALEDPSHADVRAWVEETVTFWSRNRVIIEASEQALDIERRVADYWWGGVQRAVDAMPRHLSRFEGAERERERIRLVSLMSGLERLCYFWVICGAPLDREVVLDAQSDLWHALLTRSSIGAVRSSR